MKGDCVCVCMCVCVWFINERRMKKKLSLVSLSLARDNILLLSFFVCLLCCVAVYILFCFVLFWIVSIYLYLSIYIYVDIYIYICGNLWVYVSTLLLLLFLSSKRVFFVREERDGGERIIDQTCTRAEHI